MKTLMEETLNNQADWVLFESYFNSTHQNFMDRLRQRYSDLTTGDLRICCLEDGHIWKRLMKMNG